MDSTPSNAPASKGRIAAVLALAIATVAAYPADARADGSAEKLAAKALRKDQVAAFVKFKKAVNTAEDACRADVKAIEKQLSDGAGGSESADALFQALVTMQTAMSDQLAATMDEQASAAVTALSTLDPETEGVYPNVFYPGDRTDTAGFEDAVDEQIAKTYRRLKKHLAHAVDTFDAAGVNLSFRIAPPRRPARIWFSSAFDSFPVHQPTIDLVVAWSAADATADGQIRAAGAADSWAGIADDVIVVASFLLDQPFETVTPAAGRWVADFDLATFAEGVWLVGATQNSSLPVDMTIGVR